MFILIMKTEPNIFDYNDFRAYLRDAYDWRHEQDENFTKAQVCKSLGLPNSRSYFQDVLNGKFVSQIKIPLFIEVFDLSREEAKFFRVLVNFNQAVDDPEERSILFEQLVSLNRTPKKIISQREYAYYREWHHSVVRAVLNIINIKKDGNYAHLARSVFPPVTEKNALESVELLLELELIHENESGFLKPTQKVITTGAYAQDEIIRLYQLKSLEKARRSLLKNNDIPQRVITKMVSVSEEGYNRILKNIEKCNREITSIVHKDEKTADRVYQVNLMLFPHSSRIDNET